MENTNNELRDEFGLHQTFECYRCDKEKLDNPDFIHNFLNDFPGKLGMKKMLPPVVVRWHGNSGKDPGGLTGFVLIAESHISIHTFPELKFFTMDLYSCKTFDTMRVKSIVKETFHAGEIEENIIKRGLKFRELAPSKSKIL